MEITENSFCSHFLCSKKMENIKNPLFKKKHQNYVLYVFKNYLLEQFSKTTKRGDENVPESKHKGYASNANLTNHKSNGQKTSREIK